MPLRSVAAPGLSAIRWLPLTMREERFDFDDCCSNSPSPIADCFCFPFEEYDFVAVYEVETILKHRRRGRGYQYYVKWKGYPITKATWETESAFSDDGNMLQLYKDRYQL